MSAWIKPQAAHADCVADPACTSTRLLGAIAIWFTPCSELGRHKPITCWGYQHYQDDWELVRAGGFLRGPARGWMNPKDASSQVSWTGFPSTDSSFCMI